MTKVYQAIYHEGQFATPYTLSIHLTKEGAEKAIAEDKERVLTELRETGKNLHCEALVEKLVPSYDWFVSEVEVKP